MKAVSTLSLYIQALSTRMSTGTELPLANICQSSSSSVKDLMWLIAGLFKIPVEHQTLLFQANSLEPDKTLGFYKLKNDDVIVVANKIRFIKEVTSVGQVQQYLDNGGSLGDPDRGCLVWSERKQEHYHVYWSDQKWCAQAQPALTPADREIARTRNIIEMQLSSIAPFSTECEGVQGPYFSTPLMLPSRSCSTPLASTQFIAFYVQLLNTRPETLFGLPAAIHVTLSLSASVKDLMKIIEEEYKIPLEHQTLLSGVHLLESEKSLSFYHLQSEDVLVLADQVRFIKEATSVGQVKQYLDAGGTFGGDKRAGCLVWSVRQKEHYHIYWEPHSTEYCAKAQNALTQQERETARSLLRVRSALMRLSRSQSNEVSDEIQGPYATAQPPKLSPAIRAQSR